jgi:hypothetical protein
MKIHTTHLDQRQTPLLADEGVGIENKRVIGLGEYHCRSWSSSGSSGHGVLGFSIGRLGDVWYVASVRRSGLPDVSAPALSVGEPSGSSGAREFCEGPPGDSLV